MITKLTFGLKYLNFVWDIVASCSERDG